MNDNRTSQAMQQMLQDQIDGVAYDEENGFEDEELSRLWLKKTKAIADKYKRMEDTFLAISSGDGCYLHQCGLWASEALAYDPLSSSKS